MSTRTLTDTATITQDISVAGEVLLNLALSGGDASINTSTGALTVSKIGGHAVTLGGALTTSGAYATTLTITNTTAITLPTSGTLAILGANTFTTLQTITQANANTGILASTGYSLTGSNATSMLSLAGTLNTSGNPNVLSFSVTNTGSGATTKYLNLLAGAAGATSVFSVDMTGKTVGASLALGGATIGTDILAVTGKSTLSDRLTVTQATANTGILASTGYSLTGSDASSMVSLAGTINTSGAPDIISSSITNTAAGASTKYLNLLAGAAGTTSVFSLDLSGNVALASSLQIAGNGIQTSPAAATHQLGAADAASPVAQTLKVQSVVTATADTAGTAFTIAGSKGTGTGAAGAINLQIAPAGGAGSTPNTLATILGLAQTGAAITSPLAAAIGLTITGASAQAANLLNITANAGTAGALFKVAADGTVTLQNSAILTGPTAAALQLGAADAASPVAQTLQVQNVVGGTSNTAGTDFTVAGSIGTGTGAGGQIIFRTAPAKSTNTTQNTLATGLTITAPAVNMQPSVVVGNQALATSATDGFIYIPSCAGAAAGTPTTFTGRLPLVINSTGNTLAFYNSAWKIIPTLGIASTWTGVQTFNAGIVSAAGASTGTIQALGILNSQVSSAGVSPGSTGNDNVLAAYTLPASAFDVAGREIMISAYGSFAATANLKQLKIYVGCATATVGSAVSGGVVIGDGGAVTSSGTGWRLVANVVKYGAASSNTQIGVQNTGMTSIVTPQLLTMTESGTVLIAVTGNATIASSDIVFNLLTVEYAN